MIALTWYRFFFFLFPTNLNLILTPQDLLWTLLVLLMAQNTHTRAHINARRQDKAQMAGSPCPTALIVAQVRTAASEIVNFAKQGNTRQLLPPYLPIFARTVLLVGTVLPLEQHHRILVKRAQLERRHQMAEPT